MIKTLGLAIWLVLHPVHVTLTSIDCVQGTDSVKVFVRMYYDDFLLDYHRFDSISDPLSYSIPGKPFPENLMNNYINGKVSIIVNNKELKGKLLNLEQAENEISLKLLYRTADKPEIIRVKNMIMTELYSDQANMLIVRAEDFEEGVKLTSETTEQTFIINAMQ